MLLCLESGYRCQRPRGPDVLPACHGNKKLPCTAGVQPAPLPWKEPSPARRPPLHLAGFPSPAGQGHAVGAEVGAVRVFAKF